MESKRPEKPKKGLAAKTAALAKKAEELGKEAKRRREEKEKETERQHAVKALEHAAKHPRLKGTPQQRAGTGGLAEQSKNFLVQARMVREAAEEAKRKKRKGGPLQRIANIVLSTEENVMNGNYYDGETNRVQKLIKEGKTLENKHPADWLEELKEKDPTKAKKAEEALSDAEKKVAEKKVTAKAITVEAKSALDKIDEIVGETTSQASVDTTQPKEAQLVNEVALAAQKLARARLAYLDKPATAPEIRLRKLAEEYQSKLTSAINGVKSPGFLKMLGEIAKSIRKYFSDRDLDKDVTIGSPSWTRYREAKKQLAEVEEQVKPPGIQNR